MLSHLVSDKRITVDGLGTGAIDAGCHKDVVARLRKLVVQASVETSALDLGRREFLKAHLVALREEVLEDLLPSASSRPKT